MPKPFAQRPTTPEERAKKLKALQAKIDRACEARRIAEAAFEAFKASPDWELMCEEHGFSATSNFGDWTC
jgi:hypothetical protein